MQECFQLIEQLAIDSAAALLSNCGDDLDFIEKWVDDKVYVRLRSLLDGIPRIEGADYSLSSLFPSITYSEAIER